MPTLASLDPADGATWIYRNKPVTLELTRSDSNDYQKIETSQADFAAGTLASVMTSGDALILLNQLIDDFAGDTVGQMPAGWSMWTGSHFTVETKDAQNALRRSQIASEDIAKWDAAGDLTDVDTIIEFNPTHAGDASVLTRISGTFGDATARALLLVCNTSSNLVTPYYRVGTTWTAIGSSVAFTFSTGAWYCARFRTVGTAIQAKAWARSGSEPGAWLIDRTDNHVTSAGRVGLRTSVNAEVFYDNVRILGTGSAYAASGNRISPACSLATVVAVVGGTWIEWTADVPAGCTLTVEASVNGSTWYACTNGAAIPTILTEGTDVSAVSLYLRESMTGDGAHTPTLYDVTVTFRPVEPRSVEVVVNGVSCTVANGLLDYWNTTIKSGSAIVDCHKDVWLATRGDWWDYGPEEITVLVMYKGTTISTTTFETASDERYSSRIEAWWLPRVLGGMFDGPMGALAHYFVGGIEPWLIRVEAHYHVTTMPRMGFDAYYWVAHLVSWDGPGAVAVGHPALTDGPASVTVQAYAHGDGPGAAVVQGYVRGDGPGAVAAGVPMRGDGPAAVIAATPAVEDGPAAAVVYEVNRRNIVEIKSVSAATKAAMDELELEADEE